MDYFELYGIAPTLRPDEQLVQKTYYLLCRKYHPDQFSLSDAGAQEEAIQMTSLVNEARAVLLHHDRRLEYLLREKGLLNEDSKQELPAAFLMQMMDFNEALMEAKLNENSETLKQLQTELLIIQSQIEEGVQPLLESNHLPTEDGEWQKLKTYYLMKKYLNRIAEQMQASQ